MKLTSSFIQSPLAIKIRSNLRKSPFGRKMLQTIAGSINKEYEARFNKELLESIKSGDTVWDIGANIGFYTRKFLDIVGTEGHVVAVEPAPSSANACRELINQNNYTNLTVVESALSSEVGTAELSLDEDPTSPTNRLSQSSSNTLTISVTTGDFLLENLGYYPNIIKIDVEGFEVEVLKGMETVLSSSKLRAVFIEVHFKLLEENGYKNAIEMIVEILNQHEFSTKWIDFSHIVGFKSVVK